jgi:pimeloyl-ACP methyl ester carboxylesterase
MGADAVGQFEVRSRDGTRLAVWVRGEGPPVVLVHGSIADHTGFDALVGVLQSEVTTYCMDRRGFGASDDGPGAGQGGSYAIEDEFDDVAAVVDAVARRAGRPVTLWGHSYGANCALGGAALTPDVERLVLYEPSFGLAYPPGSIERIEAALAAGDREAAIEEVLVGILELDEEDVRAMRASPLWPVRVAAAHTVARECRAEQGWVFTPGRFDAVTAPTLFLTGSETVPSIAAATEAAAAAVAGAEVRVLDGHAHLAHRTDPALVAGVLTELVHR